MMYVKKRLLRRLFQVLQSTSALLMLADQENILQLLVLDQQEHFSFSDLGV